MIKQVNLLITLLIFLLNDTFLKFNIFIMRRTINLVLQTYVVRLSNYYLV